MIESECTPLARISPMVIGINGDQSIEMMAKEIDPYLKEG